MAPNVRSAVFAGAIAFVIYAVIALLTGASVGAALGVALVFFVGTAAITLVVSTLISRSKARGRS